MSLRDDVIEAMVEAIDDVGPDRELADYARAALDAALDEIREQALDGWWPLYKPAIDLIEELEPAIHLVGESRDGAEEE